MSEKKEPTGQSITTDTWFGRATHTDDGDPHSYFNGQIVVALMVIAFVGGCVFGAR